MRSKTHKLEFSTKSNWFSRRTRWQKVLIIIGLVILMLGLAVGGYAAYQYSKLDRLDGKTEGELSCVDVNGYVNILLLGVDSRNMVDIQGNPKPPQPFQVPLRFQSSEDMPPHICRI